MPAESMRTWLVAGGRPTAFHMAATDRPKPSTSRPPVRPWMVIAMDASTAGCRTPKCVIPEAIFAWLVTWPSAPASTAKSLVPQRSLSQTVPSPSRSAARAWSRAGRGSDTRPGSTYAPSAAGTIGWRSRRRGCGRMGCSHEHYSDTMYT